MNWITFSILAYLFYALQIAIAPVWTIRNTEPMLLLIMLVFIGLQARAMAVAWAALVLGVLVDMSLQQHEPGLIGPWAIGFLAAGYAMVQLRNLLFRDSMFTIAIMTMVAGIFAFLVATTIHVMRGIPILGNEPAVGFSAVEQLYRGFFTLIYTSIVAIPVGYMLLKSRPIWGLSGRGTR